MRGGPHRIFEPLPSTAIADDLIGYWDEAELERAINEEWAPRFAASNPLTGKIMDKLLRQRKADNGKAHGGKAQDGKAHGGKEETQ